ncbi:sulfotransferase domain protein [Rubidibacter lacunae KORDI 51-2]|uniref:Sulfotransferase domain protein n=1 Tax=Rubidibacter lacunae KORDI 51-2 TaxID=582515 RepID=U5D6U8_9CHRO|nr:sulfotransferase [Rubidibacter lacunae]ERN40383.1 sulfotransferase domain protein [Rubidibacter lacunae KORDI 51-2]
MRQPDFIIIGAMKCATSSLHEQLARQPGIFMTDPKEPDFFSDDQHYARGWGWYCSLFAAAAPGDLCGESSTHYTKLPTYPQTVGRMHASLPEIKLVYIMRHPIERLVSQYAHEWSVGAIAADTDINVAVLKHPELVAYSRYSYQLQPYRDTLGRDRILPVFFERLLSAPQDELTRICHFLDYRGTPTWADLDAQNVSKERWRRTPLRQFLLDNPLLTELRRRLVPKTWRNRVRRSWTLKTQPKLDPQVIIDLESLFDADLEILGEWLGLSLTCSTFKETARTAVPNWVT